MNNKLYSFGSDLPRMEPSRVHGADEETASNQRKVDAQIRRTTRTTRHGCNKYYRRENSVFHTSNPYYNLRYHPSAPFICSRFLVSYRIRSAMKFSQNVLHYKWHTSRVYVIHIKSLSRYFLLTQNWTDKAKWRSIETSNNVNKHTGHVGCWTRPPPAKMAVYVAVRTLGGGSHGAVLNSTGINS